MKATGSFDVTLQPLESYATGTAGTTLGRMSINKTFQGDLAAKSLGEMLTAMTPTEGSAGYVAIEQVRGTLHGKQGTFVLQHFGITNASGQRLVLEVVPDSGTGELASLAGTMIIQNEGGQHSYQFDYSLQENKVSSANDWNKQIIEEFRANEGKVGGQFANTPLLLLHTTGAKSGLPRINPVAYLKDGERYVIIASKGGAPANPDWYYNIVANPEVAVEVGTEQVSAKATVAEEPERTQLYEKMAAKNPGFAEYQRKTTRVIPVIVLTPEA